MLTLTECVWVFRNNALWDTHLHALMICEGSNNDPSGDNGKTKAYMREWAVI